MTEQPQVKARAGWYPVDDGPQEYRRWDGDAWVDQWATKAEAAAIAKARSGPDLSAWWMLGILGSVIGGVLLGVGADSEDSMVLIGIILLAVSGVVLQVAVIATGVSLGLRHRDALRWHHRLD